MNKRNQPVDWRAIYATKTTNVWDTAPHEYTRQAALNAPQGYATDLGCGEGYDALYLAESGFSVTAVDISDAALDSLARSARARRLDIATRNDDVRTVRITRPQSLIASYGVLHFLGDAHEQQMRHLQQMTTNGGVHSLYVFGDTGDFYDIARHDYWFPNRRAIRELYDGWHIERLEEKRVDLLIRGDNGELLQNSMIKVLAQKTE